MLEHCESRRLKICYFVSTDLMGYHMIYSFITTLLLFTHSFILLCTNIIYVYRVHSECHTNNSSSCSVHQRIRSLFIFFRFLFNYKILKLYWKILGVLVN